MFSLNIERCNFLGINISFHIELSVWCSCLWSLVCCDASLYTHLFFHPFDYLKSLCISVPSRVQSILHFCMVVVHMGWYYVFVVVLVPPIVLMRVVDIPVFII